MKEIGTRFGRKGRRRRLLRGLHRAVRNLERAGVRRIYIDGSFTSAKADPADVDGCWDADGHVDVAALDPVFLDFSASRAAMKRKYGVDFFVANAVEAGSGKPFVEFFQTSREGDRKGVLLIDLEGSTWS